jgi:glycosyltransferase involved in cell wall biosynthesis
MRILYISNLYPPAIGGSQVHLHCLAKAMQEQGNDVEVVTHTCRHRTDWLALSTVRTEKDQHFIFEGVPVWQMGYSLRTRTRILPWALGYYALMPQAVRAISSEAGELFNRQIARPDIVHATRNGREFIVQAGLDFARRHHVPFVLTPNHHPRWRGWRYREFDRIYREADALFVLTEPEKKDLIEEKGVAEDKVHVTGVGPILSDTYSDEAFRDKFDIHGRFVLYLGQQFRYKGVGALLHSAPLVWQRHPDVTFVFIGPQSSYSKRLFAGVKDHRVRNLGAVDIHTKTSALAACNFLCLPSAQESFGGVYVEAWSLGKAVIGGRIPPIAALISEGTDGLLSSQKPPELADAVSYLLSNPKVCMEMGAAGFQKVQAKYTWKQLAAQIASIYSSLLEKV